MKRPAWDRNSHFVLTERIEQLEIPVLSAEDEVAAFDAGSR